LASGKSEADSKAIQFVAVDELAHLVERILTRHGMSEQNASVVARTCLAAERDGASGHGLFRVAGYVSTLKSGWVDGKAIPVLAESDTSGVVRVDARNGFAQPALELAKQPAIDKARKGGVCIIAIRNSHHLAALWPDVEMFAREGLIAFAAVNAVSRVVPWGGQKPVYGTNPMAFAAPRQAGDPLVFDQASSAMAFGEVRLAALAGHELPEGVGVDRSGRPTTSAKAIVDGGALLPFGGYKGSSIAMMIEVLAAALTGGNFSYEVDFSDYPGAQTPRTGEFVLLIEPRHTGGDDFTGRVEGLVAKLHESGQSRMPGDRRYGNRARANAEGIVVSDEMLKQLRGYLDAEP
jgi:delta1-piperideine-2-carboxylate reductase